MNKVILMGRLTRDMTEAFYYFIQFDAEGTVPAEIEQDVRIMDNVLRFLCVRKDEA